MVTLPIFYSFYIFSYVNKGSSIGYFRVHKYYKDIDYVSPYNEEYEFTEPQVDSYRLYSFVYVSKEFGIILK